MADSRKILVEKTRTHNLIDDTAETNFQGMSKSGTKRLFHDRSSVAQAHGNYDAIQKNVRGLLVSHDSNGIALSVPDKDARSHLGEDAEPDFPAEKRSRTSDWPLRSNANENETPYRPRVALGDRYDALNSASMYQQAFAQPRPSKFLEGSMKDRASQKPHPSYIGDPEEFGEQLEAEQNAHSSNPKKIQSSGLVHHTNRSVPLSATNDRPGVPRPSSIFRFGKSVAAAFNPSTWKIWSKQQEDDDNQEKRTLRERQEKAEKVYKELKPTGQLRNFENEAYLNIQDEHGPHKHDSGMHFEHQFSKNNNPYGTRSKTMETRIGKGCGKVFRDLSSISSFPRSGSLSSETPVPSNYSQSYLPESSEQANQTSNGPRALRRLPSRKDLQKQQKLVKRVSDLEGKLEVARRQLAEALGESVPVHNAGISRSGFYPCTLASLPSEGLLNAYTSPDIGVYDNDTSVGVGRALSIDGQTSDLSANDNTRKPEVKFQVGTTSRSSSTLVFKDTLVRSSESVESRNAQNLDRQVAKGMQPRQAFGDAHQGTPNILIPAKQTTKKRKSIELGVTDDDGRYKPAPDSDDDGSSEASKVPIQRRKPGRPRKLQKVDPEPKSLGVEPNEVIRSILIGADNSQPPHGRKLRSPKNDRQALSNKTTLSPTNNRITKKARYTGQEAGSGSSALQDEEDRGIISIVPSVDVPQVLKILGVGVAPGQPRGVPAGQKRSESHKETDAHENITRDQRKPDIPNKEDEISRVKTEEPFEWPADVF